MSFKTIEEANEYKLKMEQQIADIQTAKQGVEAKLAEVEKVKSEHEAEINRLKIKNYEYFEQISLSTKPPSNEPPTPPKPDDEVIAFDDIMKDFK